MQNVAFQVAVLISVLMGSWSLGCKERTEKFQNLPHRNQDHFRLKPRLVVSENADFVIDPFCGMKMQKNEAAGNIEYRGKIYYFCTIDHLKAFKENPEKYLDSGTDFQDDEGW